ncbi:MAG: dUTP diphosphatase [Eggerthellaceae bacterium]|nr:dUTP diphosphatase [Eggerthellaceae bacterium]
MSDTPTLSLPIQMFYFETKPPAYAHVGDAGLDLRSTERHTLRPFERAVVSCGFAAAIPEGYAGLVVPRSGLAARHGISVVNGPGLIDSGYRGEIKAVLVNLDAHEVFEIEPGDRIAQLVVVAVPSVNLKIVDELPPAERGAAGFGSSGVR